MCVNLTMSHPRCASGAVKIGPVNSMSSKSHPPYTAFINAVEGYDADY